MEGDLLHAAGLLRESAAPPAAQVRGVGAQHRVQDPEVQEEGQPEHLHAEPLRTTHGMGASPSTGSSHGAQGRGQEEGGAETHRNTSTIDDRC